MRPTLDRQAVSTWLAGQKAAEERIQAERVRFLLALTPKRSLKLYLDLWPRDRNWRTDTPSSVLAVMRSLLARAGEKRGQVG